jgi:ketosteroid isomerase-like protein
VHEASKRICAAQHGVLGQETGPVADLWVHDATVTTMHPIGGREVGWDQVREPWAQVAELSSGGQVKLSDQLIHVVGDMAYEVGTEQGQLRLAGQQVSIDQRVTNIYRQEGGVWKIVHHHTDLSPAMLDVLSRLQAET